MKFYFHFASYNNIGTFASLLSNCVTFVSRTHYYQDPEVPGDSFLNVLLFLLGQIPDLWIPEGNEQTIQEGEQSSNTDGNGCSQPVRDKASL